MINIIKQQEPTTLIRYREAMIKKHGEVKKKHFDYIPQNIKEDVQSFILKEQSNLCCYCMKTISKDNIVIEHFKPKGIYNTLALSYDNLLGSCKGCTGRNPHCDKNKGQKELNILPNPADIDYKYNQFIDYSTNGEVKLKNAFLVGLNEKDKTNYLIDLNQILNLNEFELKKARTDKLQKLINLIRNNNQRINKCMSPDMAFRGFLKVMLNKKIGKI
jgi:uncharacterized protein (TIGR02646 family)